MDYKFLQIEIANNVATVTINRPEVLNGLHPEAHSEMEKVWEDLGSNKQVKVAILTGAGSVFSAGGDLKDMESRLKRAASDHTRSTVRCEADTSTYWLAALGLVPCVAPAGVETRVSISFCPTGGSGVRGVVAMSTIFVLLRAAVGPWSPGLDSRKVRGSPSGPW